MIWSEQSWHVHGGLWCPCIHKTPRTCGCSYSVARVCVSGRGLTQNQHLNPLKIINRVSFTFIMLVFRGMPVFPSSTTDCMAVSSPGFSVPHVPQSPFETDTSHPSPPRASSPGWADFPPPFGDDTPQFSATNSAMSPVRAHSSLAVLAVGSRIERLELSKRHEGETVSHRRFNSRQCRWRGCICRTRYIVSPRAAYGIECACVTMLQRYNVASLIVAPPKPFWQILPSAELTLHQNNTQPMHTACI